jgi:hypothetical protein
VVLILPGVCGKFARTGLNGFFPAVETFRSLRPIQGERKSTDFQGEVFQGELKTRSLAHWGKTKLGLADSRIWASMR